MLILELYLLSTNVITSHATDLACIHDNPRTTRDDWSVGLIDIPKNDGD